jgi:hypothetical protein
MQTQTPRIQSQTTRPKTASVEVFNPYVGCTAHSALRQQERSLPDWQIEFALRWGTRLHRCGAIVCHVRRKDLPVWLEERHARKLEGVTAVVADGCLITAYRKRGGFHDLKRTPRYRSEVTECEVTERQVTSCEVTSSKTAQAESAGDML